MKPTDGNNMNKKPVFNKVGWLDSVKMPSCIHLTNDGNKTVCGSPCFPIKERTLTIVPKKYHGRSQFCRICFKNGHKSAPWHEKCLDNS